jgi:hypothetical protein
LTLFERYKNNKFQVGRLCLDKIFYKIMYHHIIHKCDFFVNLDDFFRVLHEFS